MSVTKSIPSYDLLVSLDRSDSSAALALLDFKSGAMTESNLSLAPEALEEWWRALQNAHPHARIAVAFEQPAPNLLGFFSQRSPAAIYALNPVATWAYRQALVTSRARDDQSDARHQALYVSKHLAELTAWTPPPAATLQLERLTFARRKRVNDRTALTNQLQAALKRYFPQALELLQEDLWRPMNLEFLRKWPTIDKLRAAPLSRLRAFYNKHNSRSAARWEARTDLIQKLVPLCAPRVDDLLDVETLVDQIETLNTVVQKYDATIRELFEAQAEAAARVASLPGAGPTLAPRLYVVLTKYVPNCESPECLAAALGIAPIKDQSGFKHKVLRRLRCDIFTRQTLVEWAKESWKHSTWAAAFVRLRQEKGQGYHAIIRALAYKWIRILWRCWRDCVAYDEIKYLDALRKKGSPLAPAVPSTNTP